MKKIWDIFTEKRISIAMLIVFVLSLLPILMLALYNYPCADDFSASDTVHLTWINTGSVFEVIKAAWDNVVYNYLEWSGVFMSVFWTSLQFGIFGERFYGVTTLLAVALFVSGGFYLGHVIFTQYLKINKYLARCVIILYLFTSIQCMPDGNEGLYWHAGVVNYTWAFAFLLLLLGVVLSIYQEENRIKKINKSVLGCVLAVCVGGGNYLTALQGSIWLILVSAIVYVYTVNKKGNIFTTIKENIPGILPTVMIIISFAISVLAPGNRVRMSTSSGMNPIKAILVSFHYFLNNLVEEWITWPIIVLLAIAIPFMWHMTEKSNYSFRYPGIVAVLGFGMVSAGFTPNLYAQGDVGGGRLADTIFFIWIFWLYVVAFYIIGWIQKSVLKEEKDIKIILSERSKLYILGMICFWGIFSALTVMIDESTYIGTQAGYYILSGQAETYRQENEARLEILYDSKIKNVVFQGFSNPPELLIFQDITYDENEWLNQVMAEYYGKESVKRE